LVAHSLEILSWEQFDEEGEGETHITETEPDGAEDLKRRIEEPEKRIIG
jgi:hypothetical protein